MPELAPEEKIVAIYSTLARIWGRQHWWPAQSRFEVILGAFLTQNTSWTNVESALRTLRAAQVLSVDGIRSVPIRKLESLVRSSGYFRQKALRLRSFVQFLDHNTAATLTRTTSPPLNVIAQSGTQVARHALYVPFCLQETCISAAYTGPFAYSGPKLPLFMPSPDNSRSKQSRRKLIVLLSVGSLLLFGVLLSL